MKNLYKNRDIFTCSQEAHTEFNGKVSVFHVLKQKECYPQGCIYFLWHCVLLEKNKKCVKGFNWAGRECKGCMHFIEEKVHLQPQLAVSEPAYEQFLDDLEDFELWLDTVIFKRLPVAGTIAAVKPWFERILVHTQTHLRLLGYLIILRSGFIGNDTFEDTFYIRISRSMMDRFSFLPGMAIECTGEIRLDRGRVVVHQPKRVELSGSVSGEGWTLDRALVAVKTAVLMTSQPEPCLACQWGALADVIDRRDREESRFRNMYCLKGIGDAAGCPVRIERLLREKQPSL